MTADIDNLPELKAQTAGVLVASERQGFLWEYGSFRNGISTPFSTAICYSSLVVLPRRTFNWRTRSYFARRVVGIFTTTHKSIKMNYIWKSIQCTMYCFKYTWQINVYGYKLYARDSLNKYTILFIFIITVWDKPKKECSPICNLRLYNSECSCRS